MLQRLARSHVAVVSRISPFHSAGGMQAIAWDIARYLAGDDLKVTFLTTEIRGRETSFKEEGVNVESLRGAPPGKYSRKWWTASLSYFREHLIQNVGAVLSVSAGAYGLLAARRQCDGVRFVMQAHGTALNDMISKWRTRQPSAVLTSGRNALWLLRDLKTYRRFDRIVCVGETVRRAFLQVPISWFVQRIPVTAIPNGIDTQIFSPDRAAGLRARSALGWAPEHQVVVTTSRLYAQKGVDHALRGFAQFANAHPRARYLIIGEGREQHLMKELSQDLGIASQVRFTGAIPRKNVAEYLRAADVFLFTNTGLEGLPLNLLEAAAVGLPLVVSESLEDVATECSVAWGVDPRDPKSIAAALESALSSERIRAPVLDRRFPVKYTLQHCAQQYRQVLFSGPGEE